MDQTRLGRFSQALPTSWAPPQPLLHRKDLSSSQPLTETAPNLSMSLPLS